LRESIFRTRRISDLTKATRALNSGGEQATFGLDHFDDRASFVGEIVGWVAWRVPRADQPDDFKKVTRNPGGVGGNLEDELLVITACATGC